MPNDAGKVVEAFRDNCTKCASTSRAHVFFKEGPHPTRYRDFLRWYCQSCGYVWFTETADYKGEIDMTPLPRTLL